MKQLFIKVLFVLALLAELKGNESLSGLEILWNYAECNNYEVVTSKLNEKKASEDFKIYWEKKIPSISTSTSYSFEPFISTDLASDFELISSLTITEEFYNGTGLLINPKVSFLKTDVGDDILEKEMSYLDSFELEVGIYQNLYPFWLQGHKINPDKQIVLLKQKEAQCLKKIEIMTCMEQIAELYVEFRKTCRNLDCLQNYLIFLREKKKVLEELKDNGNISFIEILKLNDEIQDYYSEYLQLEKSKQSLSNQIFDKSGFSSDDVGVFESIDFFDDLPLEFVKEVINPKIKYYLIQKEFLQNEYIVTKQNNAPVAKLGMSLPFYNKKSDSLFNLITDSRKWDVSLTVDFSPMVFQNSTAKENYLEWDKLYERKIETTKINLSREKDFYLERENEVEKACNFLENLLIEKNHVLKAMENLFEQKNCNLLELIEARVNQLTVSNRLKNLQDEKWYYFWMKQIRDYEY